MSEEIRNPEVEPEQEAPEAQADTEPASEAPAPEIPEAAEPPAVAEVEDEAIPPADELDVEAPEEEAEEEGPTLVEGPASFASTREGRRRSPRSVGQEVRLEDIDYKNVEILSRFVDNFGRIYNRRKTRVSAKMQRRVTRAIKRARHLALMPYTYDHIRMTRRR